jgi:hypothetical protein
MLGALVLAVATVAPTGDGAAEPAFKDYPVIGPRAVARPRVDLSSHPRAKRFKTMLTQAARGGPNFAGHFRIVEWGCGSGCAEVAVIDLISGKVTFPPELGVVVYPMPVEDEFSKRYGLLFRVDSRLLVVNGVAGPVELLGAHYFQLSDGALLPIRVTAWDSEWNKRSK